MLMILWFLIKWTLVLLIIYSLLHSLITHFIVWFEFRLKFLEGSPQEPIPIVILFKSFLIESFCTFVRFFLYPFVLFTSKLNPKIYMKNTPVLLVHGYMQNKAEWVWFKQQLEKNHDIGPIYSVNLSANLSSIAKLAENLKKAIQDIQQETQQNTIILIGHSMGGLVCSYYSEYLANPGEVSKIITLGTPFQGTRLAALGRGENVKEMSPHSFFLGQLRHRIQQSSTAYHYIASRIDNLIVPWHSAFPTEDHSAYDNKLILDDHGHLRLLISPQVIQQVAKWIQKSS